jgi:hypothetical protein
VEAPYIYISIPGLSLSSLLLSLALDPWFKGNYLGDPDITSHLTYPCLCLLRAVTTIGRTRECDGDGYNLEKEGVQLVVKLTKELSVQLAKTRLLFLAWDHVSANHVTPPQYSRKVKCFGRGSCK